MPQHFTLAGFGYTGRALAPALTNYGNVVAIARSQASLSDLPANVTGRRADLGTAEAAGQDADVIIYLAPPPAAGERDTTLEAYLSHLQAPRRIVYASTSGVYGDCGGARVDEQRRPAPKTARATRRYAAECALQQWCAHHGTELVVLRVAGIYGPGRLPLERLRRKQPVLREQDAGPGNRIHVADLAAACVAAATASSPPQVINICDGDHMSSTAFTKLVAAIAGLPAPAEITLEQARAVFTPMRWSFADESRRLDNTRLVRDLAVRLRYADPRDGVRASLAAR